MSHKTPAAIPDDKALWQLLWVFGPGALTVGVFAADYGDQVVAGWITRLFFGLTFAGLLSWVWDIGPWSWLSARRRAEPRALRTFCPQCGATLDGQGLVVPEYDDPNRIGYRNLATDRSAALACTHTCAEARWRKTAPISFGADLLRTSFGAAVSTLGLALSLTLLATALRVAATELPAILGLLAPALGVFFAGLKVVSGGLSDLREARAAGEAWTLQAEGETGSKWSVNARATMLGSRMWQAWGESCHEVELADEEKSMGWELGPDLNPKQRAFIAALISMRRQGVLQLYRFRSTRWFIDGPRLDRSEQGCSEGSRSEGSRSDQGPSNPWSARRSQTDEMRIRWCHGGQHSGSAWAALKNRFGLEEEVSLARLWQKTLQHDRMMWVLEHGPTESMIADEIS